ncbi:CARDB domain-containing protein, partial [Halovivax sp.]|uniref:CARDB domain-containing protein n=1 Tax=Halovivax sp. TaxID=1935978 RepID=UPI0025C22B63
AGAPPAGHAPDAAGGTAPTVADATPAEGAVASTTGRTDEEVIEQRLALGQLPDEPGEFQTEARFVVPDAVERLEVELPPEADVEGADGFESAGGSTYEWTGATAEPSVTFRLDADERRDDGGHAARAPSTDAASVPVEGGGLPAAAADEGYDFVETGEWGIVAVPQLDLAWTHERGASISVERSAAVDGPGAVGETIAVFGEVDEHVAGAGEETHRLVVPEAADLVESPDDVLDALAAAEAGLAIGATNDGFFVVAAPTDDVEWRAAGLQYGADDAWVRADARLDDAPNVWLHEYVHSRQPFAGVPDGTTDETRWLVEGQADYYGTLLALEQELISHDDFRAVLERGQRSPYDEGVLAEPDSWGHPETDYARGPLALAAIDREIRLATDGDRTLATVFRDLNRADHPIEHATFLESVKRAGGADARAIAERYVETEAIPDTWSASEHREAFGGEATAFAYAFDDDAIEVTGEYRVGEIESPDELVPGETASIPVSIENVDDRTGTYDAILRVDGDVVDERGGELAAGERTSERLEWTPEDAGTYELRIGEEHRTVEVREPAAATVTDVSVSPRAVDVGEEVTATVTVTGEEDRPSEADVVVSTPDGTVDERTVSLGPGETETFDVTVAFEREGRNEVSAGDESTVVGVGTVAGYVVRAEAAIASTPTVAGVGAAVALVGLAGLLAIRRRG